MKKLRSQVRLGIILITLSALTYGVHYFIFRDPHHIFIYLVGDIAFVFFEVLMVTLIIDKVLEDRERRARLEKLNTVIGVFFSELGTDLLAYFSDLDPDIEPIRRDLLVSDQWTEAEFTRVQKRLRAHPYKVEPDKLHLENLRTFLVTRRGFLLSMMENPNLMEHEDFTELLRAIFHLAEELKFRERLDLCPMEDLTHMAGDIDRAYTLLVREWLAYMHHLKDSYPYLFSLAMRTNPFDREASVIVNGDAAGPETQKDRCTMTTEKEG